MPAIPKKTVPCVRPPVAQRIFTGMAGLFLLVAILKFGTPVILDRLVTPPENFLAAVIESWQLKWGFRFVAVLLVGGLLAVRWKTASLSWSLALPLFWLGWQFLSAGQTVNAGLTAITLEHFTACVLLFYLGYFALRDVRNPWPVWLGLSLAVCCVIRVGFEQHFGGLEATRQYIHSLKDSSVVPLELLQNPAYQKRLAGNRIFSTFAGYANALAGCFVLLLPVTLAYLWQLTPKVRPAIRWVFVAILGGCGLACLYWSGSKAGWLVALVLTMLALGHSTLSLKWKRGLIYGALVLGLAVFGIRNAKFFERQNNSVGARFTYWRTALKIAEVHPFLGTGPGTFSILYANMKAPEDEMARLCHNDYLEQACDSGLPGFFIYSGMIFTYLLALYRYRAHQDSLNWLDFSLRLGILGICLHSLVEFHLYIPSLAWPMFFLLGLALRRIHYR